MNITGKDILDAIQKAVDAACEKCVLVTIEIKEDGPVSIGDHCRVTIIADPIKYADAMLEAGKK